MQVSETLHIVDADESTAGGGGGGGGRGDSEAAAVEVEEQEVGESGSSSQGGGGGEESLDEEPVEDVSGNTWELSALNNSDDSIRALYMYNNVFNLIPQSIGGFDRLKTLKFFSNEINLFPEEIGNLVELERLQVKISSPRLSGLPLQNLKFLKELQLFKVPQRPSAFPLLGEISSLTCLTKLAVCHFSIRFLPPEIGYLTNLEDLDLSFNKLRGLPNEITALRALQSLKVANNKLVELPPGLSSLQMLETLDLSNNRLTSLGSLELASMPTLRELRLQYNKLLNCCQIPSWICCNLEGNGNDTLNNEFNSSSADVDICDVDFQKFDECHSCNGSHGISSSISSESSSSNRSSEARRIRKGWKRRDYLQQRARQECLNSFRKWRSDDYHKMKVDAKSSECKLPTITSESLSELSSLADCDSSSVKDDHALVGENDVPIFNNVEDEKIICDSFDTSKEPENDAGCESHEAFSNNSLERIDEQDGSPACDISKCTLKSKVQKAPDASKSTSKSKRHSGDDLENPKPSKSQKPFDDLLNLSNKYNTESFCGINDRLPDGFYDAGRDRRFMPLHSYDKSLCLDSREVILVDRETDEWLDTITSTAQESLPNDGNLRRASRLALFVSARFGGSDSSNDLVRKRKASSGSNYLRPFVCTCPTGNGFSRTHSRNISSTAEKFNLNDLCEKHLWDIKQERNSNIVPIGAVRLGVCRHRAVLMKYLCDRMVPPIPCELVRGYFDFSPHAWNIILVRREDSWVRMVVDSCRPTDIREETDPEYFCRYIPSSKIHVPMVAEKIGSSSFVFPSVSSCDEFEKTSSSSLKRFKFGSVEAAAKIRTLNASGASVEDIQNFEYTFLGEVRLLGALRRHSCIVEIYGHRISTTWVPSVDGNTEHRLLQSAILMEYIEGGSLKNYVKKLAKDGEKRVPVNLALVIARDIAFALAELHSQHIIHRDIKSENVLIDLDRKQTDGSPLVKLCDFDRAVPLRSFDHTCCIAHHGVPRPDVCVGTPRWMAPEVLQAMHIRKRYGLEIDIWSYGCLLLELLTLEIPYAGLPESEIHDLLQAGQRPGLTDELEALVSTSSDEAAIGKSSTEIVEVEEGEVENVRFLVDLYRRCTKANPHERPTAGYLHDVLHVRCNSVTTSLKS